MQIFKVSLYNAHCSCYSNFIMSKFSMSELSEQICLMYERTNNQHSYWSTSQTYNHLYIYTYINENYSLYSLFTFNGNTS